MRPRRRPNDSLSTILLTGLATLVVAGPLLADHGNRRSTSTSVSNQRSAVSRPAPRSRLLPPAGLGSAAGAPPGFYSRHLSVPEVQPSPHQGQIRQGPGQVVVPYPYPVYVLPPDLAVSPSQVIAPPAQDVHQFSRSRGSRSRVSAPVETRPQAPVQPVIVIQQPPAAESRPVRRPPPPRAPSPPPAPRSTEPAPVSFSIVPADARVYLDDELVGTGVELAERTQAMSLRPGVYVLEVTHPDHRSQRVVFGVQPEAAMDVAVDLTTDRVGRRSRVR